MQAADAPRVDDRRKDNASHRDEQQLKVVLHKAKKGTTLGVLGQSERLVPLQVAEWFVKIALRQRVVGLLVADDAVLHKPQIEGQVVDPVAVLGVVEGVFLKEEEHDQNKYPGGYGPRPTHPTERPVEGDKVSAKRTKVGAQRVRQVVYRDDGAQLVAEEDAGKAELDVSISAPKGEPGQHLRAVRVTAVVHQGVPDRAEKGEYGAKQNDALAA